MEIVSPQINIRSKTRGSFVLSDYYGVLQMQLLFFFFFYFYFLLC